MKQVLGPQAGRVYREMRVRIADGQYPTGTRLPSRAEVAQDFHVAIMTVRQAFDRLEREGLIESQQGRGTYVRAPGGPAQTADTSRTESEERYWRLIEELRESEERFRATFEQAAVGMAHVGPDDRYLLVNQRLCDMLGYTREELLSRTFRDITHPDDLAADLEYDRRLRAHEIQCSSRQKRYIRKDGSIVWINLTVSMVRQPSGDTAYFICVIEDITDRKKAQDAFAHQALHDALTGLPNRALLHDRLKHAVQTARRDGTGLALLLMDLNGFKDINDTFGHHYGDELLQQVASRLCHTLRETDTIARLGGDEFAVVLPATDRPGAERVVEKMRAALERRFPIDQRAVHVGASIGIALSPEDGGDSSMLLRHADVAMYMAKRARSGYAFYDAGQDQYSPTRLALISDLREAIEAGQLVLHYQPKIHLGTGCAEQVEALVRWNHPRRGLIPPGQFIPLAEDTDLIVPLTHSVLNAALQQCHSWQASGLDIGVAVNVSTHALHDPQLPRLVATMLRRWRVQASSLVIEITESALMARPDRALHVLNCLHGMGVQIAIDDFGTGYSSLAYLKQLPVAQIKIDRSFVMDMDSNDNDAVIVRSVIDLGHNLGLEVVAEGVENQATREMLAAIGCDAIQGYLVGRPMGADGLEAWLEEHRSGALAAAV